MLKLSNASRKAAKQRNFQVNRNLAKHKFRFEVENRKPGRPSSGK
jgi:hypothetical protein